MPLRERGLDMISDLTGQSKGYTQKQYAQRPQPVYTEPSLEREAAPAPIEEYGPLQFLGDLAHPESDASQTVADALYDLPHHSKCRRIAFAGNSLMAAGAALSLAQQGEKVCLVEFGFENQQGLMASLLGFDATIGVSDVFKNTLPLDNLIITARMNRPHPGCYVLPQGRANADWIEHQPRFTSLINALSKKFHRVIISIPSLDKAAAQAMAAANIGWILADPASPLHGKGADSLQQQGCSIRVQ